MGSLVTYQLDEAVATITLDDGKVNVMSLAMQREVNAALDRAEADHAVVVLTGRAKAFSAGFDLATLRDASPDAGPMVSGGFALAARVLSFPTPVVMATAGHTIAMGAFLFLSGDHLIGAEGDYRLWANEVAIGLPVPAGATEVLRSRLTPAAFHRAAALAEPFSPAAAVAAGFLDELVEPAQLLPAARAAALRLAALDMAAHHDTKLRTRAAAIAALRADAGSGVELSPT